MANSSALSNLNAHVEALRGMPALPYVPGSPQSVDQESNASDDSVEEPNSPPGMAETEKPNQPQGPHRKLDEIWQDVEPLDDSLRDLETKTLSLGGSARMAFSCHQIRYRIRQVANLFYDSASPETPFGPHPIRQQTSEMGPSRRIFGHKPIDVLGVKLSDFPTCLDSLVRDMGGFLECINEFPPYNDEAVNSSVSAFEKDLKYWASCLRSYTGSYETPGMKRYLRGRWDSFKEHLGSINTALAQFTHLGVDTIKSTQNHAATNLTNLATIATFLSAVTASTLQYSLSYKPIASIEATEGLWFSSLVLSIGAAVNYLQQYSRNACPLVGSGVDQTFSSGIPRIVSLVLFNRACSLTLQSVVVHAITTAVTIFTTMGLAIFATWFSFERWIFYLYGGEKMLSDVLLDFKEKVVVFTGLKWTTVTSWAVMNSAARRARTVFWRADAGFRGTKSALKDITRRATGEDSESEKDLESAVESSSTQLEPEARRITFSGVAHLVRSTIRLGRLRAADPEQNVTVFPTARGDDWRLGSSLSVSLVRIVENTPTSNESVRHIRFSPQGDVLVVWRSESAGMYSRDLEAISVLRHALSKSRSPSQVLWSSDSHSVLARYKRSVKLWSKSGKYEGKHRIPRVGYIEQVSGGFLSVEGSDIRHFDFDSKLLPRRTIYLEKITPQSIVSYQGRYLIILALLNASPDGSQPDKFAPERQLIFYNMDDGEIEGRTPVESSAETIILSRCQEYLLVDYPASEKGMSQLWQLRSDGRGQTYPELKQTYTAREPRAFVGPACFGGERDQWVIRAAEGASVYMWDRQTDEPTIVTCDIQMNIQCLAWNPASNDTFVVGDDQGNISMWRISRSDEPGNNHLSLISGHRQTIDGSRHGADYSSHAHTIDEVVNDTRHWSRMDRRDGAPPSITLIPPDGSTRRNLT
ncbi:hypothetical protein NEOLEDRAFT_1179466 [Neolentinus lepideus HHB14362 ss-1]|uniref:WD40 repeat-like protein n=1 Tax=Neolentinus lepideus HHB14362 ss-1 TaxID=1314782 RepID=A0A165RSN0_9AGAM|nr:hypothetical protein NEOLEDRAFT_1179466 [Neolentinus lepideus HHB14362 ss-1]